MAENPSKQVSFPPVYTRDESDITRMKHAAIDAGMNFSEYQYMAIMQRVDEDETKRSQQAAKEAQARIRAEERQG